MKEVTVDKVQYEIGEMPAKTQWAVFRRLSPVIAGMGAASINAAPPKTNGAAAEESTEQTVEQPALSPDILTALAAAVSKMSDDDSNYIIDTCLSYVRRQSGQTWARLTARNGELMFPDIKMTAMLQLTFAVIEENIGDFLVGAGPQNTAAPSQAPASR